MDDRTLTTHELHHRLDLQDLTWVNRRRARRGLRPLYLEELAERWTAPDYNQAMRELEDRR